jgi:decaprenyl-phosphate phosphoribosyltransferase
VSERPLDHPDAEPSAGQARPTLLTVPTSRARSLRGLLALSRPLQWPKGALVAAAPLAAGRWVSVSVLAGVVVALFAFTVAAIGGYMINDVVDVERDRWHPTKRVRPLVTGTVGLRTATTVGVSCLVAAPTVAVGLGYDRLALVVGIYVVFATTYSLGLKHLPMIEIAIVASGFVLRALAGVAATGVPASGWFLVVVCAGAVMVAVGKRSAELSLVDAAAHHRSSLHAYSARGLSAARLAAAVLVVGCYLGWVVTRPASQIPAAAVSAVAVAVATGRFLTLAARGEAGAPERLLISDRLLHLAILVWLGALLAGPAHV